MNPIELKKQNTLSNVIPKKSAPLYHIAEIHSAGYERTNKMKVKEGKTTTSMKPIAEERNVFKKPPMQVKKKPGKLLAPLSMPNRPNKNSRANTENRK